MDKLKLTKKEVTDYYHKNQYAMMRFGEAADDYVAARCLILNSLFAGFILASQAIEKLLKAIIFLETGKGITNTTKENRSRGWKHNPLELKNKLKESKDYELDKYDNLLDKLFDHYNSRYYENTTSGKGASTEELLEIDELWLLLVDKLPIPDEVKYRSQFFAELFEEKSKKFWRFSEWVQKNNLTLLPRITYFEERYKEVKNHLYSNLKK